MTKLQEHILLVTAVSFLLLAVIASCGESSNSSLRRLSKQLSSAEVIEVADQQGLATHPVKKFLLVMDDINELSQLLRDSRRVWTSERGKPTLAPDCVLELLFQNGEQAFLSIGGNAVISGNLVARLSDQEMEFFRRLRNDALAELPHF